MNDAPINGQDKVEQIYLLTKENNEILRTLRRGQRISMVFKVLYWAIIIGTIGGAYYYSKPFIDSLQASGVTFSNSVEFFTNLKNHMPEAQLIQSFLETLRPVTAP